MHDNLKEFLKSLTKSLEKNELDDTKISRISEFFMSYNFQDQTNEEEEFQDEELVKFLSLGWYVYTHLIPTTT